MTFVTLLMLQSQKNGDVDRENGDVDQRQISLLLPLPILIKKRKVEGKGKEHDAVRKYVQNYQLSISGETIGRQKKCNEGLSEAIAARQIAVRY